LRVVSGLSETQKMRRAEGLKALKEYYEAGKFPQNYDYPGARVPYFIDSNGTPCAVAHIMIESGHGSLANSIVETNNHIYLDQVEDSRVIHWQEQSGFTWGELRLIQPSYEYVPRYTDKLLELSYLGNEKGVREILEKENPKKPRLNLALQVTAQAADFKMMAKYRNEAKKTSDRRGGIEYQPPPYLGEWKGVVVALIEKGADPLAKNSKGQSAIDLAKEPEIRTLLAQLKRLASNL
jgi:hypothetical protein